MTPMIGPERARTDLNADDLRKPSYGRLRAITIRWTWLVPS
jgi:hypothetical protein